MNRLLNSGDTIAIVSPSVTLSKRSAVNVDAAKKYFETLGFKVAVLPTVYTGLGLTPDSDIEKARDIMAAYANPDVKALVAAHGGASSLRLHEHLDFDLIRHNPKPIIGFSDSTSVQLAVYAQTGLPYITGFLCEYDFRNGDIDSLVDTDLQNVLTGIPFQAQSGETLRGGTAEGIFIGGNLSIISDLSGSRYYPSLKDKILLLEDECEKPYKIGLMLTQLRYNPEFKHLKGIVIGRFSECDDDNSTHGSLDDIINDFARQTSLPMIKNFDYGHFKSRHVMTCGVKYRLDADNCRLEQIV